MEKGAAKRCLCDVKYLDVNLEEAKVLDIFLVFFLSEAFTEGLEFFVGVKTLEAFVVVAVEIDYCFYLTDFSRSSYILRISSGSSVTLYTGAPAGFT